MNFIDCCRRKRILCHHLPSHMTKLSYPIDYNSFFIIMRNSLDTYDLLFPMRFLILKIIQVKIVKRLAGNNVMRKAAFIGNILHAHTLIYYTHAGEI